MRVGVVGYGFVGKSLVRFLKIGHEVAVYDKFLAPWNTTRAMDSINKCDVTFVAVPTPTGKDGLRCDISAVEEVVRWIDTPICLRSTVPPGTVDTLVAETGKEIAFSPEYIGESTSHPWNKADACGFLIVGGTPLMHELTCSAYRRVVTPDFRFLCTDPRTAELCKYMENCFLATKVAFVNQFYDIATALSVPFEELRQLWLADSRIGESHTNVTSTRGFDGKCLPKDLLALIGAMRGMVDTQLLEAVARYNRSYFLKK